jgi:hypothetical protein
MFDFSADLNVFRKSDEYDSSSTIARRAERNDGGTMKSWSIRE